MKNENESELTRWSSAFAGMPDLVLKIIKVPGSTPDTYTINKDYYFDNKEGIVRKATLIEVMLYFLLSKE